MILEHLLTHFLFRFTGLEVTACVMACVFFHNAQKFFFIATGLLKHADPGFILFGIRRRIVFVLVNYLCERSLL